ncbi:gamma-glutamylcyclotransferase family protein [Alkalicoccus daliensis]|uniref:Uncharacterized conserved protein YtfP, gamma-glutamylcyclotransferase (GGCT)/AIG2-like family n=1 Tax=Alkalicoccus daliensis TaxID=745820 RepID=A0A1H0AMY0_9BACI|nr:gamma-glutamylcyclotransferase family protein [Alkalicoccus daliensis]SDN34236.1 Uncharacterized conserved protein YtfP, gamma-glutamylcyclotransferase (GGCT)/AIG2-like family [Alkalicoccus daliensis]
MFLFVYGTLRKGETNHALLQGLDCIAEQAYTTGNLYDTGYGYPGYVEEGNEKVFGEIYFLPENLLPAVDRLEGYQPGRKDNLYERITKKIITDEKEIEAVVYVYNDTASLDKKVPFQDWKVYQWLKEKKAVAYFAYGSCMDTERIEAAGMEDAFQQWEAAEAENHRVDYTQHRADGARANLLEAGKEPAEGILYTVPSGAVEYLFRREGVKKGAYRPAFINVRTQNRSMAALTFIVLESKAPKAPPWHYAKEILRGAQRGLSREYQHKLLERMKELNTELYPEEL